MESQAPDIFCLIEKLEGHLAELRGLLEKEPGNVALQRASTKLAQGIRALRAGAEASLR